MVQFFAHCVYELAPTVVQKKYQTLVNSNGYVKQKKT